MKKWDNIGEFNDVLDSSDEGMRAWWKATVSWRRRGGEEPNLAT